MVAAGRGRPKTDRPSDRYSDRISQRPRRITVMFEPNRDIEAPTDLAIDDDTFAEWQGIVDLMADLADVPAGLIMRLTGDEIEVFLSSRTDGNPYARGDAEHFADSGLYCETVINTRDGLLVPNALEDPDWAENPDVELGMISYLGYPILLPNRIPFGTICVLDRQPNAYSDRIRELMTRLRDLIQHHLELLYMNHVLGEQNRRFIDHLEEIRALRGLIPICAWCKKIKDDDGYWNAVETYLARIPDARFSHAICPDCVADVERGE